MSNGGARPRAARGGCGRAGRRRPLLVRCDGELAGFRLLRRHRCLLDLGRWRRRGLGRNGGGLVRLLRGFGARGNGTDAGRRTADLAATLAASLAAASASSFFCSASFCSSCCFFSSACFCSSCFFKSACRCSSCCFFSAACFCRFLLLLLLGKPQFVLFLFLLGQLQFFLFLLLFGELQLLLFFLLGQLRGFALGEFDRFLLLLFLLGLQLLAISSAACCFFLARPASVLPVAFALRPPGPPAASSAARPVAGLAAYAPRRHPRQRFARGGGVGVARDRLVVVVDRPWRADPAVRRRSRAGNRLARSWDRSG